MVARSSEELTKVVANTEPFHSTVAAAVKPLPVTASARGPAPACAVAGASALSRALPAGVIWNGRPAVTSLPVATVTVALPGLASSGAGTVAPRRVAE